MSDIIKIYELIAEQNRKMDKIYELLAHDLHHIEIPSSDEIRRRIMFEGIFHKSFADDAFYGEELRLAV